MKPAKRSTANAARLRRRKLRRLLKSPRVRLPLWLGMAALFVAALSNAPTGALGIVGIVAIVFALFNAVTRWFLHGNELAEQAQADLRAEAARNHQLYLHDLWRRLRLDQDPRTKQYLLAMRRLYQRMERTGVSGSRLDSSLLPEIREKTEQLYRSALVALEHTLDYWIAAHEMVTAEGRREAISTRETLLAEVGRSIDHLNTTLDHLQAAALRHEDQAQRLADVRQELDMGLEVAKRVESRMDEFDRSLRSPGNLDRDQLR